MNETLFGTQEVHDHVSTESDSSSEEDTNEGSSSNKSTPTSQSKGDHRRSYATHQIVNFVCLWSQTKNCCYEIQVKSFRCPYDKFWVYSFAGEKDSGKNKELNVEKERVKNDKSKGSVREYS